MSDHQLPAEIVPYLRRGPRFLRDGEQVTGIVTRFFQYPLDEVASPLVSRALPFIDGNRNIGSIARAAELSEEEIQAVMKLLYNIGVIGEETDVLVPARLFYEHIQGTAFLWPLRGLVQEAIVLGEGTPQLGLGALIEEWHYIKINPSHISAAVQNATNPRTQQIWSRFLAEEYNHGLWLEEGLRQMFTKEELEKAHPLPSTANICNSVRWLARTDELSYAGCLSISESENDGENWSSQTFFDTYKAMVKHGWVEQKVVDGYIRHIQTDLDVGHFGFCREIYDDYKVVTLEQRRRVLRNVWDFHQCWHQQQIELHAFYNRKDAPRFFSLPHEERGTGPDILDPIGSTLEPRVSVERKRIEEAVKETAAH